MRCYLKWNYSFYQYFCNCIESVRECYLQIYKILLSDPPMCNWANFICCNNITSVTTFLNYNGPLFNQKFKSFKKKVLYVVYKKLYFTGLSLF